MPQPAWYRFTGASGTRMPTSCVPMNRCGTHASGWMEGEHPSVGEGIVSRKVCYHWSSQCCNWNNNIEVRQCPGGFFVYKLVKPPHCSLRYCGSASSVVPGKVRIAFGNVCFITRQCASKGINVLSLVLRMATNTALTVVEQSSDFSFVSFLMHLPWIGSLPPRSVNWQYLYLLAFNLRFILVIRY